MPCTNINSEWIKNLKPNIKAISVLEENVGKCFYNYGMRIRKIMIQGPETMKIKTDICDGIKKYILLNLFIFYSDIS